MFLLDCSSSSSSGLYHTLEHTLVGTAVWGGVVQCVVWSGEQYMGKCTVHYSKVQCTVKCSVV